MQVTHKMSKKDLATFSVATDVALPVLKEAIIAFVDTCQNAGMDGHVIGAGMAQFMIANAAKGMLMCAGMEYDEVAPHHEELVLCAERAQRTLVKELSEFIAKLEAGSGEKYVSPEEKKLMEAAERAERRREEMKDERAEARRKARHGN